MTQHKGKFYQSILAGPWSGVEEVTVPTVEPGHHWRGPKIPQTLWQQVLAFLAWSQAETKSEAVIHLFFNAEQGLWDAPCCRRRDTTA